MHQYTRNRGQNSSPVKVHILIDETGTNKTQANPQIVKKKKKRSCRLKKKGGGGIENNRNVILDGLVQKVFTEEETGKLRTKEW